MLPNQLLPSFWFLSLCEWGKMIVTLAIDSTLMHQALTLAQTHWFLFWMSWENRKCEAFKSLKNGWAGLFKWLPVCSLVSSQIRRHPAYKWEELLLLLFYTPLSYSALNNPHTRNQWGKWVWSSEISSCYSWLTYISNLILLLKTHKKWVVLVRFLDLCHILNGNENPLHMLR